MRFCGMSYAYGQLRYYYWYAASFACQKTPEKPTPFLHRFEKTACALQGAQAFCIHRVYIPFDKEAVLWL